MRDDRLAFYEMVNSWDVFITLIDRNDLLNIVVPTSVAHAREYTHKSTLSQPLSRILQKKKHTPTMRCGLSKNRHNI